MTFEKPTVIDDVTLAFPAHVVGTLMPLYKDIPDAFRNRNTKWNRFQSDWFSLGISSVAGLIARPGIDKRAALRHLGAINGSWEPKHEHKEAAVAYLASLWFEDASTWEVKT